MMYATGSSFYSVWIHIHWVFVLILLLALVAGIVWMIRFASKQEIFITLLITGLVGLFGMLLTAPVAYQGLGSMMQEMMGNVDFQEAPLQTWGNYENLDGRLEGMQEQMQEMMDFVEGEENESDEGAVTQ